MNATATGPYAFTSWGGDAVSTANPLSLAITAPMSISANFGVSGFSCDIVSDPHVNQLDVAALVLESLSGGSAHDLSRDGITNVIDIQKVINAAMGLGCVW